MEMIANTVRMVDHDQAKELAFGDNTSLKENLAIGLMNPTDFKRLNLFQDSNIKLTNNFGMVIIKAKQDENIPLGIINIPLSIWANQITGIENNELIYKNIKVEVEATKSAILDIEDLLKSIRD